MTSFKTGQDRVPPQAALAAWRSEMAQRILQWTGILGTGIAAVACLAALLQKDEQRILFYLGLYALVALLAFVERIPLYARVWTWLGLVYAAACLSLVTENWMGWGLACLFCLVLAATVFVGQWAGVSALTMGVVTLACLGLALPRGESAGIALFDSRSPAGWLRATTGFGLLSLFMILSFGSLLSRFMAALSESHRLIQGLEQNCSSLELQVTDRTRLAELARRDAEAADLALSDQMWEITGLVQLGDRMRGEQALSTLAANVIQHICHYLNAQVGVLYVQQGDVLSPVGSYACPQGAPNTFRVGEGWVGQAARDKYLITVINVPPDYLQVTSGLGSSHPRIIVVTPFIYDDEVIGVVELGALAEFSPAQILFLQKALENVAIAFNTALARNRIDELLAQTQKQADALQLQGAGDQ